MSSNIDVLMKVMIVEPEEFVVGEHKNPGEFFQQIECQGWEWGMSFPTTHAGARASGVARVADLTVLKKLDRASPRLLQACHQNEQCEVTITQRRSQVKDPNKPTHSTFYTIVLKEARVNAISRTAHEGLDYVTESVSFSFKVYEEFNEWHAVGHIVDVRGAGGA